MSLANRRFKATLLLLCVAAMNTLVTTYPSLARGDPTNDDFIPIRIDHSLLNTIQKSGSKEVIQIIVTFDALTYDVDSTAFIRAMKGSSFVLKYRFSIIPAVSGRIHPDDLDVLKSFSASMPCRVSENREYTLPLGADGFGINAGPASLVTPSQLANWWHDMIGRNQSLVDGLDLGVVKVGVLDTGIGFEQNSAYAVHADLASCINASVNFASGTDPGNVYDRYGHGTHVAGIIAGSGASSGNQYAGIAPGAKIFNIKVLNDTGSGFEDDIIMGIEYAVNESLDIINLSLGGGNPDPFDPESMAVRNATEQGVLVVVANGNSGPYYLTGASPAAAVGALSVGAVDQSGTVTAFSSRGPSLGKIFTPDVVAPGADIVSTLGEDSFLQRYYEYFDLTIAGSTGTTNDYIALDGTSMATPVVAGAAAIIKAKFPEFDLPPAVVAASLLGSAVDLGRDTCTQGMGLINITGAIAFLEDVKVENNLTRLARIFPGRVPYAPYDVIDFPGQKTNFMVKMLHHGSQSIHFESTGVPAGMVVAISPNATTINDAAGQTWFNLSIGTGYDAVPGNYSIDLAVKNASGATLDTVAIRFELRAPKLKVYLDSYHSIADLFTPLFPLSRFAMDYYPYIKQLASEGIRVDTGMDYWTAGYNSTQQRTMLDDSWLRSYDVVILPPLKAPLFDQELAALARFHRSGGHVVVLGSRFQEFSIGGGNAVLEALGVDASFLQKNVEFVRDNGWENDVVDLVLTRINSTNPLATGVSKLAWRSGCAMINQDPRVSGIASTASGDTLLAFLPSIGGNGSVLVGGSESLLPSSMPASPGVDNVAFFGNFFTYARVQAGHVRIDWHIDTGIPSSEPAIQAAFQVFNTTSGVRYNLTSLAAAACAVSNASGVQLTVGLVELSGGWFGNNSIDITPLAFSGEPYIVTLNATIGAQQYTRQFAFLKLNRSTVVPALDYILYAGSSGIYRGTNLTFMFDASMENETMILSGNPGDILSQKSVTSAVYNVAGTNSVGLSLDLAMPAGIYSATFAHATRSDIYPHESGRRVLFSVNNREPDIDTARSSLEGNTIASLDLGNGMVSVVSAQAERPLDVVVAGSDHETTTAALDAFVIFYPICLIGNTAYLIPYGSTLIMETLPYDAATTSFRGSIEIPAGTTFRVGSNEVERQFTSWGDYASALIVVLRDDDGGFDIEVIFLNLIAPVNYDLTWIIVLVLVGGVLGLVLLVVVRRRLPQARLPRAIDEAEDGDTYRPEVIDNRRRMRYCPYCAAEVKQRVAFCPFCGERIDFD